MDSVDTNKEGIERRNFKKYLTWSIHRFLEFMKEIYEIDVNLKKPGPHDKLIERFRNWMKDKRDASKGTQDLRCHYLKRFFDQMKDAKAELSSLTNKKVEDLFLAYAIKESLSGRRSMQATLRLFFSFCHAVGRFDRDLGRAIPTLRTYRLDKVPRGISDKEALQLIDLTKPDSVSGVRDRAILQLLYSYGIRGGQVRALKLEEIQWELGFIRFSSFKQGKEIILPLTLEVGECLLEYLEKARPVVTCPEVFVTTRAPYRPLCRNAISQIVRYSFLRADVHALSRGSHVFRHNFATRMLAQGNSLKTIADLLGHRHQETTFQYTKVDFRALDRVAMEWPEVNS